jgi:hypothetical protein
MRIGWVSLSQAKRDFLKGKKDHDAGQDIEKDIRDTITQGVESPEVIVHCVTENPYGLVGPPFLRSKDRGNIFPAKVSNLGILVDHAVIPIREEMIQSIEI